MMNSSFYPRVLCTASVAGLMSALTAHPPSPQGVGDIVRGLNAVVNPGDAQRLEDQARRNNRPAEERYWRDYPTALETPAPSRDTAAPRAHSGRRFGPNDTPTFPPSAPR